MDLNTVKFLEKGKPIEGQPQPGRYYLADLPAGTDPATARAELKRAHPKSFFSLRTSWRPGEKPPTPPASATETKKGK